MRTLPKIHDIIGELVDNIRKTGIITNSVESNGTYILTTDNEFSNYQYLKINDIDYKVRNSTTTEITIKAESGLDFTGDSWKSLAPYYMHEKQIKANLVLTAKNSGKTLKYQKYPLVLLLHPYDVDETVYEYAQITGLTVAIVNNTSKDSYSTDRYEDNFDPILEPIYNDLIAGMENDPRFTFEESTVPNNRVDNLLIDGNPLPDELDGLIINFGSLPLLHIDICEGLARTTYNLNLSSEGNGITEPYEGSQAQAINSTVPINAVADENNQFVRWLINGVEILDRLTTVFINKTVNAIAVFESLLVVIQDVFGTKPIQSGNKWIFENQINLKEELNILCYGNSITKGTFGSIVTRPYTHILSRFIGDNHDIINLGVDSQKGLQMLNDYILNITPNLSTTKRNVLIVFENINDITIPTTSTPQEAYEHIRDICLLAQADGIFVMVGTCNKIGIVAESDIEIANQLIRDNWTDFADELIDIHAIAEWQNPAVYTSDNIHPLDYNPLARLVLEALENAELLVDGVSVKKAPFVKFDGVDDFGLVENTDGLLAPITEGFDLDIDFKLNSLQTGFRTIVGKRTTSFPTGAWLFHKSDSDIPAFITKPSGSFDLSLRLDDYPLQGNILYNLHVFVASGIITMEVWDKINNEMYYIQRAFVEPDVQSDEDVRFAMGASGENSDVQIYKCLINNESYHPTQQQELIIYNTYQDKYHCVLQNNTSINFWGYDDETSEPYHYTDSVTAYEKISDSSILLNVGNNNYTIAGYNRIINYDNDGILEAIKNNYEGILYTPLIGEKTFTEISNETETDTFEKPGETTNNIPRLIVKE